MPAVTNTYCDAQRSSRTPGGGRRTRLTATTPRQKARLAALKTASRCGAMPYIVSVAGKAPPPPAGTYTDSGSSWAFSSEILKLAPKNYKVRHLSPKI